MAWHTHWVSLPSLRVLPSPSLFAPSVCTEANEVFSFGSNEFGELGLGHERPTTRPTQLTAMGRALIYRIACGRNHSAAVDGVLPVCVCVRVCVCKATIHTFYICIVLMAVEGGLYMWGWGGRGQLGQGEIMKTPQHTSAPLLVEGFK